MGTERLGFENLAWPRSREYDPGVSAGVIYSPSLTIRFKRPSSRGHCRCIGSRP